MWANRSQVNEIQWNGNVEQNLFISKIYFDAQEKTKINFDAQEKTKINFDAQEKIKINFEAVL